MTESLQWHPVAERMPDAAPEQDLLMWCVDGAGNETWHAGYFDGRAWFDLNGYPIRNLTVTHWAQPKGPQ
jgi:hypothetical protein